MDVEAIDFAVAAFREEGAWQVSALPARRVTELASLVVGLGAHPSESGVVGLVSVADDFFVLARVHGGSARLLLSDAAAAVDWPLAAEVLTALGVPEPEDVDESEFQPAGDITLLADLGMPADELDLLCHDADLYPDEVLAAVAARLGFGEQFDALFVED